MTHPDAGNDLPSSALVLGATGFLGSNLVRHLVASGTRVHALVRPTSDRERLAGIEERIVVHEGDLASRTDTARVVAEVVPDVVFHLAATGGATKARTPSALFEDNVLAAEHLLCATEARPECRIVYTASSLELGRTGFPLDELAPVRPVNAFGAHKAAATLLLESASKRDDRHIAILRPFAIYGPREPRRRLIPTAIAAALSGTPLPLTQPGLVRDYVFVDDVCRACMLASANDAADGQLFHIASGQETSNETIVSLIERCIGSPIDRRIGAYDAHDSDTERWCADVSKARRELGWKPQTTLEEGIRATIEWLKREA